MCELVNYEIVGNRSRPEWPERPERPEWPSWASFGNGLPCRPCTSTSLFPNPFPGHVRGLPGCCCWVAICYLERPLICFNQKLPHFTHSQHRQRWEVSPPFPNYHQSRKMTHSLAVKFSKKVFDPPSPSVCKCRLSTLLS